MKTPFKILERSIDRAVWAAHLHPDLRIEGWRRRGWRRTDLIRWAGKILAEAGEYWHGSTGLLAERLEIDEQSWSSVVQIHRPEPAESLGDSSVDLVPYIMARHGLRENGQAYCPAAPDLCAKYFNLGRKAGCHQAEQVS